MIRLGVLGSTNGTDLQVIIESIKAKKLNAIVNVVISNKKNAYILKRGQNHGLPSIFINHKNKKRESFDSELTLTLKKYNVEFILLIGFMRILSSSFCKRWRHKIINVHPSLLPKYSGGMDMNIHEQVIKNGDKESGCTIHFVTEKLDKGPILIQKKCKVNTNETPETLKVKIQELEGNAFVEAINQIAKDNN
ncbi:MAG: phosphoribosylglycinamide formyltransferase [Candidatus Marinimicrobia bacterium]|nr:phosphoribosylglycinamide formyltransferase [Candidatus Neomarinimicrobiota bacterium]|tara:strand:+ start:1006 stop:1584 length:579 start_codon:yes stop_codon:yes gene_type:complete